MGYDEEELCHMQKIGLFIPCYIDAFFPKAGIATLELLEKCGQNVEYPMAQTCCGQPMIYSRRCRKVCGKRNKTRQ